MGLMQDLRRSLGEAWPENDVVRHNQYFRTKMFLQQAKVGIIARLGQSSRRMSGSLGVEHDRSIINL
jgi:hypothetical protein